MLEADQVGSAWRGLWDGFHTNTPNWSLMLPGQPYDGADPDGFLPREEIVRYVQRYADFTASPIRAGVSVERLQPTEDGFDLQTTDGPITARAVVVCTGSYQKAFAPPGAHSLPSGLLAIGTRDYRNPRSLPDGAVLVVGSGQSGTQIAEELRDAGREVILACGRAAAAPRRFGGHDLLWWARESGFLDQPLDALPSPAARLAANVTASGVGGGHDLSARTLQGKGVELVGHFAGYSDQQILFHDDLADSMAWSDERYLEVRGLIEGFCEQRGTDAPHLPDPEPFWSNAPTSIPAASMGAVIFAGGFRPDYTGWIDAPGAFDEVGFPIQHDGASTVVRGLYFTGVHFLRTRKSSLLCGVAEDAAVVAAGVAAGLR